MEDIVRLSHLIDAPAPTACPGCGHLLFFRLIREVLDELNLTEKAIHANGIDIFTIGVGDTRGTPILIDGVAMKDDEDKIVTTRLDEKILGDIAAAGGGAYLHATDRDFGLESVVSALKELKTSAYDALVFDDYEEHYSYFYWAAFALLVLGLLPGERRPKRRLFR